MNNVVSREERPLYVPGAASGPHRVDIAAVGRYTNMAVIARYAHDHQIPLGDAAVLFEETKKFLSVCAMADPDTLEDYAPSEQQDQMWHTFVLHTRAYMSFCHEHFGVYLHHEPCDGSRTQRDRYRAKAAAVSVFGRIAPKYWPLENSADARCCCSSC